MKITVLTLFPDYFRSLLETSIIKRARDMNFSSLNVLIFVPLRKKNTVMSMTPLMVGAPVWC